MGGGDDSVPLESILEHCEEMLRDYLVLRPPPNYVARVLEKSKSSGDSDAWSAAIRAMGASEVNEVMDMLNIRGPGVPRLNSLLFRSNVNKLDYAIEKLRPVCESPEMPSSPSQFARAVECLAYLLTERHVGWLTSAAEERAVLNPESPQFIDCMNWAERALKLSAESRNFLGASRAAYNIGRIYSDCGINERLAKSLANAAEAAGNEELKRKVLGMLDPKCRIRRELAAGPLLQSLYYRRANIRHMIEIHAFPPDYEPRSMSPEEVRQVEILHRLIELAGSSTAGIEFLPSLIEFLRAPRLSLTVARRVLSERPKANRMVSVDDTTLPVKFDFGAMARVLDPESAILDCVLLENSVWLTLIHRGVVTTKGLNPNAIRGAWERFFRPTSLQMEGFRVSGDESRLSWRMSVDVLNMVPRSGNRWDSFMREHETFLAPESGWQRGLHDLLMAPFEDLLMQGGVKHLVVMADLALTLIPLHLLPNAAGVTLGERFRVSYCPAYSLIPDALSRIQDSNGAQSVLIVADPSQTLRFARWEQTMIASLFPPGNVRVMDATNASKDSLAAAVRDVDVVHFATHGRFDSEDVERSGVALQSGEWLTIDEMRNLKFKDGALVFLSACETARLKLAGRSTSLGIVPSLFEAGASTVIATFWKVNDLSTAPVAARFYDNWLVRKLSRIDSLIEAMQWVQTITADQVIEISREPIDIRGVRSLQTALAGLKQLFSRPVEPIALPFAKEFFWGPFALYGAWH